MIRQEDIGRLRRFDDQRQPLPARRPVAPAVIPVRRVDPVSEPVQQLTPIYEVQPAGPPVPLATVPVQAPLERPITPEPQAVSTAEPSPSQAAPKVSRRPGRRHMVATGLACMLIVGASGGILLSKQQASASPIPAHYQSSVDYPAYYPDPSKLPAGFQLNANSFTTPAKGILVYTISYGKGRKIDVSLQTKPSASNLQAFNSQRIPLHTTVTTPVGPATVGAIGNQSVVSLPTTSKTWIIVTAPYDINQAQLDQVLKSFKS